jgi:hypothetical protein
LADPTTGIARDSAPPSRSTAGLTLGRAANPAAVAAVAFVVLFLRRPTALLHAEFRVEDGVVFYLGALLDGVGSIVETYHGYLHLGPRLAALATLAVPTAWAPFVMNAVAMLITVGVAAFIAGPRLSAVVPRPELRALLGLSVVLIPSAVQLTWSTTYIGWSLAFFLVARAVATPPRWPLIDGLAVAAAALSTPVAILLVPLYVVRRLGAVTWVVSGAAAVHIVAYLTSSDRSPSAITDPVTAAQALGLRAVAEPVLGPIVWQLTSGGLPIVAGGLFVAAAVGLLGVAAPATPRLLLAAFGYTSIATAVAGILVAPGSLLDAPAGARYFLLATWTVMTVATMAVLAGTRHQRIAAAPIVVLVVAGCVVGFRLPPQPDYEWATRSACIGGPAPCVVPVYPGGQWDIHWPGRTGPPGP